MMDYKYLTVAELQAQIERTKARAKSKKKVYEPIVVNTSSRQICTSWWGQSWCTNLERYADYSNRIARGKRYVRSGTVVDLKITKGHVSAKVQGSRARPYSVEIDFDPLSQKKLDEILDSLSSKIDSMESLVKGEFPESFKDTFLKQGGLFPAPRQIHFDCSCPDWAYMCKHVAAVMYGIGVRLDENPLYFFELRGIDVSDFIYQTTKNKVEALLANASNPSKRILDASEDQIDALFHLT